MNCPVCNNEVVRNQLVCENCGKELEIDDLDSLNWIPAYVTEVDFESEIALGALESAEIPARTVSMASSMHLPGGANAVFKIYVPEPYFKLAKQIINNINNL